MLPLSATAEHTSHSCRWLSAGIQARLPACLPESPPPPLRPFRRARFPVVTAQNSRVALQATSLPRELTPGRALGSAGDPPSTAAVLPAADVRVAGIGCALTSWAAMQVLLEEDKGQEPVSRKLPAVGGLLASRAVLILHSCALQMMALWLSRISAGTDDHRRRRVSGLGLSTEAA